MKSKDLERSNKERNPSNFFAFVVCIYLYWEEVEEILFSCHSSPPLLTLSSHIFPLSSYSLSGGRRMNILVCVRVSATVITIQRAGKRESKEKREGRGREEV